MNLDEAASYLRISRPTLDRWIRQGLLADAGLRGSRIEDQVLADWAQRHGIQARCKNETQQALPRDLFADAVERGAVTSGSGAADAKSAIEAAIAALDLPAEARTTLLDETLERERLAATALGHGVAIPHPRQPRGELIEVPRVSVVYLDPPLDWAAVDGLLVHTALLVLSPSTRLHLQLLSRIAYALRAPSLDELLAGRPSQVELVEHLRRITRDR